MLNNPHPASNSAITLFLAGDVMPGRGIDQVLPHSCDPRLYERGSKDARDYVSLAERKNGDIPNRVGYSYPWGEALTVLDRTEHDLRIINLETSITTSKNYWPGKGVNYKMHPENVKCLTEAGIDCCSLANNHVLDWGYDGLEQTISTLENAKVRQCGAGVDLNEASSPVIFEIPGKGRVVVYSIGFPTSGIPRDWAATADRPGVNFFEDFSDQPFQYVKESIDHYKKPGDLVVISIHWGSNWGYNISQGMRLFARRLIDEAGVDVIHGHSSHHVRPLEVYHGKPIIYGCGDFINDYEGIGGYENYRDDLVLMYFPTFISAQLRALKMVPLQIKYFKLNKPDREDIEWLKDVINREGEHFHTHVEINNDGSFSLHW